MNRVHDLDGWWTCFQVDNAVIALGNRVEYLYDQFDDKHKRKYTLEQILNIQPEPMDVPVSRISRNHPMVGTKPKRVKKTDNGQQ